jgi:uncharacterized membrane protein
MRELFREKKFTDGIVHGIETAGRLLAQHFPADGTDHNELSDSVVER